MSAPRVFTLVLLACLVAAAGAAELVLTPTELVLVDGRKVQGQLAAELDTHLIVYSPGLGTIKSFRKEFVASYTKDKKPVKVSAPRALSPEELTVDLDWKGWPDVPPASGPKPTYATQKWGPPKRLLIWKTLDGKTPGKTEQLSGKNEVKVAHFQNQDPANWLVLGAPLEDPAQWDLETDVILPGVSIDRIYSVHCPGSVFRHLMVENHARIGFGDPSGMKVSGNFWIHERGRGGVSSVKPGEFLGASHTFCKNDRPPVCDLKGHSYDDPALPPKWDSGGYGLAQYIFVKKDPGISLEFLGSHVSGDKFWVFSGACILGPDSSVHSDTRNGDVVFKEGSLHLMDGAILGKMKAFPLGGATLDVRGVLTAGLPDRPLTRDATIMLGKKDYTGVMGVWSPGDDHCALMVPPGGQMRIHSADPKKARLVFQNTGFDQNLDNLSLNLAPWTIDSPRWASLPKRIETTFLGDVVLDGVLFKDLYRGGIRLKDAAMTGAWKNVVFDASCQSQKPEDNYAIYQKGVPPVGWSEDPAVKNPVISPGEKTPPRSMEK